MEKYYHSAIKLTLNVRSTTPNLLCPIEMGLPDLSTIILEQRSKFMTSFHRHSSHDEPLWLALHLCVNTTGARLLSNARLQTGLLRADAMRELMTSCRQNAATSSRYQTYLNLNPELETHPVYLRYMPDVEERLRYSFTRLRLSSHELRVETGRWSRTPRCQRLCSCDLNVTQDEAHVFFVCPLTSHIRVQYSAFFNSHDNLHDVMCDEKIFKITFEILSTY